MSSQTPQERYALLMQWSDEDQAYIVTLPEFPGHHTHGATREEALRQGTDLLETLIEFDQEDGKPLPEPALFSSGSTPEELADLHAFFQADAEETRQVS